MQTSDGYLLNLHRIPHGRRGADAPDAPRRPAVLLQHGLMMNSEVWLCKGAVSLPYVLADAGYDVWMGNTRGNRYSSAHVELSSADDGFWDFSLDELCRFDMPAAIGYILRETHRAPIEATPDAADGYRRRAEDKIAYIGFSNGTAQAFGALSLDSRLSDCITTFIALSPAVRIRPLRSEMADTLSQSVNHRYLFFLFGRRAMLGTTATQFQAFLPVNMWTSFIDLSLRWLFGWSTQNLVAGEKDRLYQHLYCYTSVKSIIHWFQCMHHQRFQMYAPRGGFRMALPPRYDYGRIKTPMMLIYGDADSLIDADAVIAELPKATEVVKISSYEHLDTMWAASAPDLVWPRILNNLASHTAEEERVAKHH